MFGGGRDKGPKRPSRGGDVLLSLEIDFMDAVNGVNKEINYRITDTCQICQGSKCKPGTSPQKCSSCQGKGFVHLRQGPMMIQIQCNACGGAGQSIKTPCGTCKGQGNTQRHMKENVAIPKGVNTGQSLRLQGKGNVGDAGGPKGDLIIKVVVRPDKYFRREDYNIITDL